MKSSLYNKISIILAIFCLVFTKAEAQSNNNSLYKKRILDTVLVINFDSLILTPTPILTFHCRVPSSFCGHTLWIPLLFETYNKVSPTILWRIMGNIYMFPSTPGGLLLFNTTNNSHELVISQPPTTDCKMNVHRKGVNMIWNHDCLDYITTLYVHFHYYD